MTKFALNAKWLPIETGLPMLRTVVPPKAKLVAIAIDVPRTFNPSWSVVTFIPPSPMRARLCFGTCPSLASARRAPSTQLRTPKKCDAASWQEPPYELANQFKRRNLAGSEKSVCLHPVGIASPVATASVRQRSPHVSHPFDWARFIDCAQGIWSFCSNVAALYSIDCPRRQLGARSVTQPLGRTIGVRKEKRPILGETGRFDR